MVRKFSRPALVWWVAACVLVAPTAVTVASAAPAAKSAAPAKDAPLKPNPALKAKIQPHVAPFSWGMDTEAAFKVLENQIDEEYAEKISSGSLSPKAQMRLQNQAESRKKTLRTKLTQFSGGAISGYVLKAPGEFTYRNSESAIEVPRPGGGERQLFFINNRLWKIYDQVELSKSNTEFGDSWQTAVDKLTAHLGDKGKVIPEKTQTPSFYGSLVSVPEMVMWSDGATNVRLVNYTKSEDLQRRIGVVYEEAATVEKLPTLRNNVEKKASDTQVDMAGAGTPAPAASDSADAKKKAAKK